MEKNVKYIWKYYSEKFLYISKKYAVNKLQNDLMPFATLVLFTGKLPFSKYMCEIFFSMIGSY